MFKIFLKFLFSALTAILAIVIVALIFFNLPVKTPRENFNLGVTFSYRYSEDIGLNWRENYLAILDDLKVSNIRVPVYWDLVEKEEGKYNFSDLDWQISEARKRDVKIILVVGQKVPRWPECHVPEWARNKKSKIKNQKLLEHIKRVVNRYKNNTAITRWQVENEPFLKFGVCPPLDAEFLNQEIAAVKSIDNTRPVVITDSGELSLWIRPAKIADIFGTTMYFTVYSEKAGYFKYPIGPNFFKFKRWLIRKFAGQDDVIIIELQGEPWVDEWTTNAPLDKQLKSMNGKMLRKNVEFAKKTGFNEIYLWGAEWWYWLKIQKNYPDVWDEARKIFTPPPIPK